LIIINRISLIFSSLFLIIALLVSACGTPSESNSGATLTGSVSTFTVALNTEKKSLFTRMGEFILPKAMAAVEGVTVSVGDLSITTDTMGNFTLNNIDTGDQNVTFTQDSDSATYTLKGVDAGETFTLNNISINGTAVSSEHTGTWTGPITMGDDVTYTMTMTIAANGNSMSGTLSVVELGEQGTFSGTEDGAKITATYNVSGTCVITGPLTGTFSGNTLVGNAPITTDSCGLEPGDQDEDSHPFTLTKS